MKIYFLRHGIAEDRHPSGNDAERRLTDEGIAVMERQAEALARLDLRLDLILSSPLVRAAQTARIVAAALGLEQRIEAEDRLAYGFSLLGLSDIANERRHAQRIMLVGHNPDLPRVAAELAGGAAIEMKRGGLIRVDADRIEPGTGVLEWLVPPAVLLAGAP